MQKLLYVLRQKIQQKTLHTTVQMVLLSCFIGVIVGYAAIGFYILVDLGKFIFLDLCSGYRPSPASGETHFFGTGFTPYTQYMLIFIPCLGGFLSGLIVYLLAPEAKGHGTDAVIDSFHRKGGKIRIIVPFVKALSSAITIGSGGSAGKEGPISQIGGGLASALAQLFQLNRKQTRILLMAGLAAGVGAIFRAPLAAAILAAEILYREIDFEETVVLPAILASIIAYSVFSGHLGYKPLFATGQLSFHYAWELLPYTVLAIVVALGAKFFAWFFYWIHNKFEKINIPQYLKPALGGIITGIIGFIFPEALSEGYGFVQKAFNGNTTWYLLFAIAIAKMMTTTFTLSSGGSGGVFGPAIVIGGCLGGTVGYFCNAYFSGIQLPVGAFILVGMAGFFASAARTPISTIIMISEITGNYQLLVPSMWVCIISFILNDKTLFSKQLSNRLDSPAKLGEIMSEILLRVNVSEAYPRKINLQKFAIIKEEESLKEVFEIIKQTRQNIYPVVNTAKQYVGILDPTEIRNVLSSGVIPDAMLASDMLLSVPGLTMQDNLQKAIETMTSSQLDELIILEKSYPTYILTRYEIIDCYDRQMKKDRTRIMYLPQLQRNSNATSSSGLAGLLYNLHISNTEELFREMVSCLKLKNPEDQEILIQELLKRETMQSTAIGQGIAIPHPRHPHFTTIGANIVLAVLHDPIKFNAPDNIPVDIFCLVVCDSSTEYLHTIQKLVKQFQNTQLSQKLRIHTSAKEIAEIIGPAKLPDKDETTITP